MINTHNTMPMIPPRPVKGYGVHQELQNHVESSSAYRLAYADFAVAPVTLTSMMFITLIPPTRRPILEIATEMPMIMPVTLSKLLMMESAVDSEKLLCVAARRELTQLAHGIADFLDGVFTLAGLRLGG